MLNLKNLKLKELLFYAFLIFFSTKLITVFYIFIHNISASTPWSYALIFSNQDINKTINILLSPLIFAPLFETLIFCVLINYLCQKVKLRGHYFIIISAVLFALFHLLQENSAWYRFSFTFIAGIILAYCYEKKIDKYGKDHAFIFTAFIHSFSNAFTVFI